MESNNEKKSFNPADVTLREEAVSPATLVKMQQAGVTYLEINGDRRVVVRWGAGLVIYKPSVGDIGKLKAVAESMGFKVGGRGLQFADKVLAPKPVIPPTPAKKAAVVQTLVPEPVAVVELKVEEPKVKQVKEPKVKQAKVKLTPEEREKALMAAGARVLAHKAAEIKAAIEAANEDAE